jgi:hypothetical protein
MGRINRYGSQKEPAKVRIFTEQLSKDNRVYTRDLRDMSLRVLSALPIPLEEELNHAADRVYGNGYSAENQTEYEGLNYRELKHFKPCLVAGTNQDWIDQVIDEREGSTNLLPEPLGILRLKTTRINDRS